MANLLAIEEEDTILIQCICHCKLQWKWVGEGIYSVVTGGLEGAGGHGRYHLLNP